MKRVVSTRRTKVEPETTSESDNNIPILIKNDGYIRVGKNYQTFICKQILFIYYKKNLKLI